MAEDGVWILLIVRLAASIAAALGWLRAARSPGPNELKLDGYLTCGWFALFAGFIAYLFDVDLISLSSRP